MKSLRLLWYGGLNWLREKDNRILTVFFTLILSILYINAFHESYPDEFDNILGGWDILHGILIYRDFFTHHGPVAYFLSAFITLFGGQSFVHFRVIFAILIFIYLVFTYWYLRRKFGYARTVFYLFFILGIALVGNFYWFHMVLADSLSGYFLSFSIAILLLSAYYQKSLTKLDSMMISASVSLAVLSSLTFLYVAFLIYLFSMYLIFRESKKKELLSRLIFAIAIFLTPYLLYLLYLILTSSLKDYLYDGLTFNQRYYIYNYPRPEGSTSINPIRYAIVIAHYFYNSYYTILQQIKDLNTGFPLNITYAVGVLAATIYFLLKRYYALTLFFIGCVIYANGRSNPLISRETDYQSAVYIFIAFLIVPFLLTVLYREVNDESKLAQKMIKGLLLLLLGFYTLFSSFFLVQRFFNRSYDKYMGNAPLIYDNPKVAPLLNKIVTKDEHIWIGPFAFQDLFYVHAKPASKYQIFIPGIGAASELHQSFLNELEKTKPPVIYFQPDMSILGSSPLKYGQFFINYLTDKYVVLKDYEKEEISYTSNVPVYDFVDLNERLYLRKENADEIISRLLKNDMIEVKNKGELQ